MSYQKRELDTLTSIAMQDEGKSRPGSSLPFNLLRRAQRYVPILTFIILLNITMDYLTMTKASSMILNTRTILLFTHMLPYC